MSRHTTKPAAAKPAPAKPAPAKYALVGLAAIGIGVGTVATAQQVTFADQTPSPSLPDDVRIATDDAGRWTVIGAAPEDVIADGGTGSPTNQAAEFVEAASSQLGVSAADDLAPIESAAMPDGGHTILFEQQVDGVAVVGTGVAVRLDDDNAVKSVSSKISDTTAVTTSPKVAAESARQSSLVATQRALSDHVDAPTIDNLVADEPVLVVYDPNLIGGDPNARLFDQPRLAWDVTVRESVDGVDEVFARRRVFIDARTGAVLLAYDLTEQLLDRDVCDYDNAPVAPTNAVGACLNARAEGDPASSVAQVNSAYRLTGAAYQYFFNNFGRDSFDDAGATISTRVRWCASSCPMANAFWDGAQLTFGEGVESADDVVIHEYTHAVIDHEAAMMYYAESGAINESFADVFGELADQAYNPSNTDTVATRWLIGEDASFGAVRSMSNPPMLGDPDRMLSSNYYTGGGDSYGVHINSGVSNKAAFLIADGGAFNGYSITGLGNAKTEQIYYEALTGLMTPGTDYLDLYSILPQACNNLVGQFGISRADCTSVDRAVSATEMDQAPNTRRLTRQCDAGTPTYLFSDDAEAGTGNWIAGGTTKGGTWTISSDASQSGSRSFNGPDPDPAGGAPVDTYMRTASRIAIPTEGQPYLWFDHSYSFESSGGMNWDGGVVEYSTNNSTWTDLGGLADSNGYNATLSADATNPLGGRAGFGANSQGFVQTRIPLSSLAGQSVYLRFRIGADSYVGDTGWYIDDISVYDCAYTAPTTTTTTTKPSVTTTTRPPVTTTTTRPPVTTTTTRPPVTTTTTKPPVTTTTTKPPVTTTTTKPPVTTTTTRPPTQPIAGDLTDGFRALAPRRLVDTRSADGTISLRGKRAANSVTTLDVGGLGIYRTGDTPTALHLTITATQPDGAGYVTAYPCGTRPNTSTVNTTHAGHTVANTATIPTAGNGTICIYNSTATHVVIDVTGYFTSTSTTTTPSHFRTLTPRRLVDTRSTNGTIALQGKRRAGTISTLNVGRLGIYRNDDKPAALHLTITATQPDGAGYVTAYPCGTRPNTSTVNTTHAGHTVANTATIPTAGNGTICIYNSTATHVVIDVTGYFTSNTATTTPSHFRTLTPRRLVDTRSTNGTIALQGKRRAGTITTLDVGRLGFFRAGDTPTALHLTITATQAGGAGYVTAYPCGGLPTTSSVNTNYLGHTVANTATIPVAPTGNICVYASTTTHVVIDVTGYFATTARN